MGVVAIAAAVAGLSGPAIAAAANAASTEEDADYVSSIWMATPQKIQATLNLAQAVKPSKAG